MKAKFRFMTKNQEVQIDYTPCQTFFETKMKLAQLLNVDKDSLQILFKAQPIDDSKTFADIDYEAGNILFISFTQAHQKVEKQKKEKPTTVKSVQYLPPRGDRSFLPSQEKIDAMVKLLQELGFEKELCKKALKAACYNCDRAADYLLSNTIPEDCCTEIDKLCSRRDSYCKEYRAASQRNFNQLDPDKIEAIKRIESQTKKSRESVIQVYFACDYDEENTISCLQNFNE